MHRVRYPDLWDYDRLAAIPSPFDDVFLMNIHNHLIWRSYVPGKDAGADDLIRAVFTALIDERHTTEFDEEARALYERLFPSLEVTCDENYD